jgi:hypothetical protein
MSSQSSATPDLKLFESRAPPRAIISHYAGGATIKRRSIVAVF